MELLPREQEKLLKELVPHDSDFLYLKRRMDSMSFDDAYSDYLAIRSLERHGMIDCIGPKFKVERPAPEYAGRSFHDGKRLTSAQVGFECPSGFILTADGRAYEDEKRRMATLKIISAAAVALASGFCAWMFMALLPTKLL